MQQGESGRVSAHDEVSVREATIKDVDLLVKFRYDFRSGLTSEHEEAEQFITRCEAWMRNRLGDGRTWKCWIAERGKVPVGNVWLQVIEKIPNPTSEPEQHAYVSNFYILEECRSLGIGSRLMDAVIGWCRTQSIHAVFLWPTERSREFYRRNGFSGSDELMQLVL